MSRHQRFTSALLLFVFTTLTSFASAQGVLTSGNSQLPACASQCALLNQAAGACPGATTSSTTTTWNCFCQSAYLKPLYTSPTGICNSVCSSASDNTAIMNWYKSNCGADFGASEHANGGAAQTSSVATTTAASTSTLAVPTASASSPTSSSGASTDAGNNSTPDPTDDDSDANKSWISTHYQWIIFVVVLIVGFTIITVLAVWWKRRYERKRDRINGGFNAGVSEQNPPMMSSAYNRSGDFGAHADGVDSPSEGTRANTWSSRIPGSNRFSRNSMA